MKMRNFFCHLSQMKSHTRQKNVRAERQMRKQDNYNCTRVHNFKARTTNGRRVLRSLWPAPSMACPGQPHVRRMRVIATGCGHTRQAWAYSRLSKNSIHHGALSQHPRSDTLLTKEWRRTHASSKIISKRNSLTHVSPPRLPGHNVGIHQADLVLQLCHSL